MQKLLSNFFRGLMLYDDAYRFIRKHRIWEGFGRYKFVPIALLVGAVFLGLQFISIIRKKWSSVGEEGTFEAVGTVLHSSIDFFQEGYSFFFSGMYKYVIFILMEVLIYHFAVRTIEILKGIEIKVTLKDFIGAQIRLFKIVIMNIIIEFVIGLLLGIGLKIGGVLWVKPFLMFILQVYLIGFLVVDNYNEILGMGIRESFNHTKQYAGVTLGIGLPLYLLMLIPVIGGVVGPMLAIVAAALLMHRVSSAEYQNEQLLAEFLDRG